MQNDRPIENPRLRKALREIQQVIERYDLAGACMLVNADEAIFTYCLPATWSAWKVEPDAPCGVRFYAKSAEQGAQRTHRAVEGALHTVCQLSDFGTQTWQWMEQLKSMLRDTGVEFEHVSFGGKPLPTMVAMSRAEDGTVSVIQPTEEPKQ